MSPNAAAEWRSHWKLVMAAMVGASMMSIALLSLGAFIGPLEQSFGWERAEISSGPLLFSIASIFLAPVLGSMIDRWGPRPFALAGTALTGLAFAAFSTVTHSIVHWLALWALFAIAAQLPRPMIWTAAIASAFKESRGLALGIVMCGGSIGSLIAPVAAGNLTALVGWRMAYVIMGLVWGGIAAAVCYFFFHTGRIDKPAAAQASADFPVRQTLLSPLFLRLALSTLLANTVLGAFLAHTFPLLTDMGLSRADVAWIVGLTGITSFIGPMTAGWLADRMPGHYVSAGFVSLYIVACGMLLIQTESIVLRIIPVVLINIAGGERAHMNPYLTSRYFGLAAFGRIFGVIASMMAIGVGIGPIIAGFIYDQTHSYNTFLVAAMPTAAVASLLILSLGHYPEVKAQKSAGGAVAAPEHAA
jgi:MFS family permease